MTREAYTRRSVTAVIILTMLGSSVITGVAVDAGQDSWLSVAVAAAAALPLVLMYARMVRLMPGQDLFEMMESAFGRIGGRIAAIPMIWYALHLGAMVIRNFAEFIHITALPSTPGLAVMLSMSFTACYLARSGDVVLGKFAWIILTALLVLMGGTALLSLPLLKPEHLRPFLNHSTAEVISGAWKNTAFPMGETVLVLALMNEFRRRASPYKAYATGIGAGSLILLLLFLRNLLVLGEHTIKMVQFPSYSVARILHVGSFFECMEVLIAVGMIMVGFVKLSVCLIAAAKGVARLCGGMPHGHILFPVAFLMVGLSAALYDNIPEMFDFIRFYPAYAAVFQILLPLCLWLAAELRHRKKPGASQRDPSPV